jgi:hypothetical protein
MGSFWWPTVVMWVGIVCIVLIGNYFAYKRRASRDRLLEKLAEHGQPLPADLFGDRQDRNPFTVAFVLMSAGISVGLFFWALAGAGGRFAGEAGVPHWLPVLGVFPFLVGVARLLGAFADRRAEKPEK